ncbi:MAG: hypothetical protein PHU23_19485 [Dehalococcoidales bacterium]|nr:hypothetical protein [Dehalococcoidales bacterium]
MSKRFLVAALVMAALMLTAGLALAGSPCDSNGSNTTVPGHCDNDGTVVGHYTSLYAYDANGDYYWDLGDGRVQGTVSSVDDLDQATLTICDYVVNYRGDFGPDPYMDDGWIQNHINCAGYDDNGQYNYLIVHNTDPRYEGNPDWAVWDTCEYHVLTMSGYGNLARPDHPVGN